MSGTEKKQYLRPGVKEQSKVTDIKHVRLVDMHTGKLIKSRFHINCLLQGLFTTWDTLSSSVPYEFLLKLRNITWETNYVIVSQNALAMMGRRKLHKHSQPLVSPLRRAPLNVFYYPYSLHYLYNPIPQNKDQ